MNILSPCKKKPIYTSDFYLGKSNLGVVWNLWGQSYNQISNLNFRNVGILSILIENSNQSDCSKFQHSGNLRCKFGIGLGPDKCPERNI